MSADEVVGHPEAGKGPIVVVLGMHRSGTSLCSHILSALGVDMADDVGRGTGNEEGHWERWELVSIHDRLLAALGRPYGGPGEYNPRHDLPFPPGWWADPAAHAAQRDIEAFLRTRMYPGRLFGFKDPRTTRLLPLWMDLFERLSLEPRFVVCVRHPTDVALSLNRRDGIPIQAGEYRWFTYNADCFKNIHGNLLVITYENWFREPQRTVSRLRRFVMPDARQPIPQGVLNIIKPGLNHSKVEHSGPSNKSVIFDFFNKLEAFENDPSDRTALDRAIEDFDRYQSLDPFGSALLDLLSKNRPDDVSASQEALSENSPDEVSTSIDDEPRYASSCFPCLLNTVTTLAAVLGLTMTSQDSDRSLPELCEEVAARSGELIRALRSSKDRVRHLEHALETRLDTDQEQRERLTLLTRKMAAMEALLQTGAMKHELGKPRL